MKCIKCCVLFFFINCSIFKMSCMNLFNDFVHDNGGLGNIVGQIINYTEEEIKKMLNGFIIEGDDDVTKLLDLKDKIKGFMDILKKLHVGNNIPDEIVGCLNNINKVDLNDDNSPTGIKKVLSSSMLFSGSKETEDFVEIDEKNNPKLIFLFHGMGGNSNEFYGSIQDTIVGFSVVSVEYNKSSLSNLDDFINGLYKKYKGNIENLPDIYILGYSFGCLIANKFRSKLLEKLKTEFPNQDKKVHFIFYKGFYDISRCTMYNNVVTALKMINQFYEKAYPNSGFAFLKDKASDTKLAEFTSNYNLLKESRQDTMFSIKCVHTDHNYFGANNIEIQDALQKIEENILDNPNMNHVLFVSSDNDNMVSEGGRMLFDDLTRPQGSDGKGRSEQSPDCCC